MKATGQNADNEHHHVLQIVGWLHRQGDDAKGPYPMILRTDLTDEVAANTHDATEYQQPHDGRFGRALTINRFAELSYQGIENTEHQQTFNIPHVANLEFT